MRLFVSALLCASFLAGCAGGSSPSVRRVDSWLMTVVPGGPPSTFVVMEKHCTADDTGGHGSSNVGCDAPYAPTDVVASPSCTGTTVTNSAAGTFTVTTIVSPPPQCFVAVVDLKTLAGTSASVIGVGLPDPGPAAWPPCAPSATVTAADIMTSPASGSQITASTTSVTVPRVQGVHGATLLFRDDLGRVTSGGTFAATGSASETATTPALQTIPFGNPTSYAVYAVGVPCGPTISFGSLSRPPG